MNKTIYTSKKNGKEFDLVEVREDGETVLSLVNEETNEVETYIYSAGTIKRWFIKSEVEVAEPVVEEEVAETVKPQSTKEMVEAILAEKQLDYTIKNNIVSINNQSLFLIQRHGIAVKPVLADKFNADYERKNYNHPFKAKLTIQEYSTLEQVIECTLYTEEDIVMYDEPLKGVSVVTNRDVEVIGEQVSVHVNGERYEQYLYNILGLHHTSPFVALKANIILR